MANTGRKFYQGNVFLFSVIAISVIFLIIVVFLVWNPFKIRSYKGMKDIELNEIFKISEKKKIDNYYIYFYKSDSKCAACNESEPFVVEYAELARTNKKLKPIFVIDLLNPDNARCIAGESEASKLKDVTNYRDLKVLYTPTLIEIKGGKVTNAYESKTTILKQLETQKNSVTSRDFSTITPDLISFRRKEHAFN